MAYDEKTGKAEYTNGAAQAWIGGGETKVVGQSSATFTYGAKTDVSISMSSSVSAGVKTALTLGASMEVAVNLAFSIKKDLSLSVAQNHNSFYIDSAVIGVGEADPLAAGKLKTLKIATWILVGAQSAVALSFAIIAIEKLAHKQGLDKDEDLSKQQAAVDKKVKEGKPVDQSELSDDYGSTYHKKPETAGEKTLHFYRTFPLGYIASCLTILTSLSAFATLLAVRFKKSTAQASPNALLSLDRQSCAFLGVKPFGGSSTAGAKFNANGIELSTSTRDLSFRKARGNPSVLGFHHKPGYKTVPGARLKLAADGNINTWGKNLSFQASGPATYRAQSHSLTALKGTKKGSLLSINGDGAILKANDDAFVSVKGSSKFHAKGGRTSFAKLDGNRAILSSGGNQVELTATKATLSFGNNKVEVSASGVKIGGALEILSPSGTITSSALSDVIADVQKWNAEALKDEQSLAVEDVKQNASDDALDITNETMVQVRSSVSDASTDANGKTSS